MQRWFVNLAHQDAAAREAARVGLMGLKRKDLPALRALVQDSRPLAPAQAAVLREIVTHVYLSGGDYKTSGRDGFLGVRPGEVSVTLPAAPATPGQEPPPPDPEGASGVVVIERMPGFCGARALQDGDVILGLVERPNVRFRAPPEFSIAVRSVAAGQTISFQILRQGQIIKVPITLDARPEAADFIPGGPNPMTQLLDERRQASDEYWEKEFAPLLKEGVG